jgi:hydrogenase-4 transcriptional activator
LFNERLSVIVNTLANLERPSAVTDRPTAFDGLPVVRDDAPVLGHGLHEVTTRVAQVASTDAPVLLRGETGSGKEVVARLLHEQSRRSRGPMVRVNCGAIAPNLVDSELFGHERGSFTGAIATRKGMFERADGGTLFLDEIAELPLAAQVRLLRVLAEGTLERVGSSESVAVSVRLVTATHRDLEAMCAAGTFRQDLWYRISVFSVRIPPLRDRLEDLPELVAHFAARAGLRLAGRPILPTPEDVRVLLRYRWPGNVRELAAVVERAAILGAGRQLEIRAALGDSAPERERAEPAWDGDLLTLEEATRRHIERALVVSRGRVEGEGGAAERLAINPHTLRGKMRKLGIDWARFR